MVWVLSENRVYLPLTSFKKNADKLIDGWNRAWGNYSQTNPKNLQIRCIYIYACVYIHSLYLEKQSPAISITGYNGLLRWFLFGGNPSGPFVASRVMGHTGTT